MPKAPGRARMHVLTPDSSSWRGITPFGGRRAQLARMCSGSLDRLVLGHLCTDRPLLAPMRIARARQRSCGRANGAAEYHDHLWGTADTQEHISHTSAARAPATRKQHFLRATEVLWRPRMSPVHGAALSLTSHFVAALCVCSSSCLAGETSHPVGRTG